MVFDYIKETYNDSYLCLPNTIITHIRHTQYKNYGWIKGGNNIWKAKHYDNYVRHLSIRDIWEIWIYTYIERESKLLYEWDVSLDMGVWSSIYQHNAATIGFKSQPGLGEMYNLTEAYDNMLYLNTGA